MWQFGAKVTVKSYVHSNGDLIIMGTDIQDKQMFMLLIKSKRTQSFDQSLIKYETDAEKPEGVHEVQEY